MKRIWPIILFSAISAAFIGPGTVATAAAAGSSFKYQLLWALLFSTMACWSLQEASARLTVASAKSLGQAISEKFGQGIARTIVIGIVLGCAAYQAGNILGAVSGLQLMLSWPKIWLVSGTGSLAFIFLWTRKSGKVAHALAIMVALMGIGFLISALQLKPGWGALSQGLFIPHMPENSTKLILGLIGTTVVPYNLFLGSSLAQGQSLRDVRLGLGVAIPLGGFISGAILIVGTVVVGPFSYEALAQALIQHWGGAVGSAFAIGLFCAGLSSAITAPWAAQLTFQSIEWKTKSAPFVWLLVWVVGLFFGLSQLKPIPVIILAQAINGILLPFVAIFLLLATNNHALMGDQTNGIFTNTIMGCSSLVCLILGCNALLQASAKAMGFEPPDQTTLWLGSLLLGALILGGIYLQHRRFKSQKSPN